MTNQQARARDFSRGEDANDLTVSVIGGGITGLAAAWQLTTTLPQGARVVLLEADARLGGKLRTNWEEGLSNWALIPSWPDAMRPWRCATSLAWAPS